jgi:hypothetical protein
MVALTQHVDGACEVLAGGSTLPASITTTLPGWGLATVIVASKTTSHVLRRRLRRVP